MQLDHPYKNSRVDTARRKKNIFLFAMDGGITTNGVAKSEARALSL